MALGIAKRKDRGKISVFQTEKAWHFISGNMQGSRVKGLASYSPHLSDRDLKYDV